MDLHRLYLGHMDQYMVELGHSRLELLVWVEMELGHMAQYMVKLGHNLLAEQVKIMVEEEYQTGDSISNLTTTES